MRKNFQTILLTKTFFKFCFYHRKRFAFQTDCQSRKPFVVRICCWIRTNFADHVRHFCAVRSVQESLLHPILYSWCPTVLGYVWPLHGHSIDWMKFFESWASSTLRWEWPVEGWSIGKRARAIATKRQRRTRVNLRLLTKERLRFAGRMKWTPLERKCERQAARVEDVRWLNVESTNRRPSKRMAKWWVL